MKFDDLGLNDSFDVFAHWWLPETPNDKILGMLNFSQASGATLTLQGIFNHPDLTDAARFFSGRAFEAERIFGEQPDGQLITLYRVLVSQIGAASTFLCHFVLGGAHVSLEGLQKPTTAIFSFDNLEEWPCASFLLAERSSQSDRTSYSFKNEPTILLSLPRTVAHPEIELISATIGRLTRNDALFERRTFFRAVFDNSEFDSILRLTSDIGQLLTILIGVPVSLIRLRYSSGDNEAVSVFFSRARKQVTKTVYSPEMPFSLFDLAERAVSLLSAWLTSAAEMRSVYSTFFSTIFKDDGFIDTRFQALVQALEGFHRRTYNGLYLDPENYTQVRDCVVKAIPQGTDNDLRERLKNAVKYGNEYSLRRRLKELINGLEKRTLEILRLNPSFQSEVVDARNYYAHLYEATKPSCVGNGKALYYINQRLTALFLVLILKDLGIPEGDATNGVIKGRRFSE